MLSAPETARFYRSVATAFYRLGELRLSGVELDGRLAAFDLSLLHRNRLYLLKTGYDEAFRRLAPGLVLRLSVIQCCFELGLDAHELLGDDSAWKRKFSNAERRHVALRAYARRPLPLARFGYRSIARPVLKRVRTSLTRGGEPSRASSRGQRGRSAVAQSQSGR